MVNFYVMIYNLVDLPNLGWWWWSSSQWESLNGQARLLPLETCLSLLLHFWDTSCDAVFDDDDDIDDGDDDDDENAIDDNVGL